MSVWEYFMKRTFKPSERELATVELTDKCGYAAAAMTLVPVPGTEVLGVMPIHVGMVTALANIYDKDITRDSATRLVMRVGATVGLSLVGSRAATTAAKLFIPGLGGIVAAPLMFASTKALGAVAKSYFERDEELSSEDIKAVYRAAATKAKSEFKKDKINEEEASDDSVAPKSASAAKPAERLTQLKTLLEQGLIETEDYNAAKARILAEL